MTGASSSRQQPHGDSCHDSFIQLLKSSPDVGRSSFVTARRLERALAAVALIATAACASTNGAPTPTDVDTAIRARTATAGLRLDREAPMPPDVTLADGLTQEEAVAIALWNSPSFQATLADLGLARADLVEAGLLRNPIFSLLFPLGPKQLEFTVQYPIDALIQRPARVAAARLNAQAIGERLVWDALALVAQVRTAHADAVTADRRVALATENAVLTRRLADITDARLRAGDISDLEARAPRTDASRADVVRRAMQHDRDLARLTLGALLGLDQPPEQLQARASAAYDAAPCTVDETRLNEAIASRPDVRAAELTIEAATARARWEQSRVVALIAVLDANGRGLEGFEMGPGVGGEVPLFNRNQGGSARAAADVERASRLYAAVRAQVIADVRSAGVRVNQAQQALDAWAGEIVPSLETEQRQAESAYNAGETPLFTVLDVSRRLVDARMRQLDAEADLFRARIALDRAIGRYCR
jgi:cobalt-zinc-cadmium efflux system outer membrane protein